MFHSGVELNETCVHTIVNMSGLLCDFGDLVL